MAVGHSQLGQNFVHRARQTLGTCGPKRRELGRALIELGPRLSLERFELANVEACRVDEIELRLRLLAGANDVVERAAILLAESKQDVASPSHLLESRRIELHGALILLELAGEGL